MSVLPLIIGHRGASAVAPENTLAAFARAMVEGADGIEFDVRLAGDGMPVVIHDATLERTGLVNGIVSQITSEELQMIDVGSWFDRRSGGKSTEFFGERLPTLQQVFDFFSDKAALLYLEMKSDITGGAELADAVVRSIGQNSMRERVIVSSFELSLIEQVKSRDPSIRTAALFEPKVSRPLSLMRTMKAVDLAKRFGAEEIALHHALASRRVIGKAKEAGLRVVVWTVDNPDWVERARSLGVTALITNNPALMLAHRRVRFTV
jgi:glycerophosphoryl diester phosphodiesterase